MPQVDPLEGDFCEYQSFLSFPLYACYLSHSKPLLIPFDRAPSLRSPLPLNNISGMKERRRKKRKVVLVLEIFLQILFVQILSTWLPIVVPILIRTALNKCTLSPHPFHVHPCRQWKIPSFVVRKDVMEMGRVRRVRKRK